MLINIEDRLKLSPPGFEAALKECFQLLPFKIQKPVRVTVQASPGKGWPRRKLSLGFGDAWLITLYAAHIDADVQRSRLYYWLFITLNELAHAHFMEQTPGSRGSDDECKKMAQDTILQYRADWYSRS